MGISLANLLIILLIVLLVFGAGKLPKVMGELGKGIKNFKEGLETKSEDKISETTKLVEEYTLKDEGKKTNNDQ